MHQNCDIEEKRSNHVLICNFGAFKLFEWALLVQIRTYSLHQNCVCEGNQHVLLNSFKHFSAPKIVPHVTRRCWPQDEQIAVRNSPGGQSPALFYFRIKSRPISIDWYFLSLNCCHFFASWHLWENSHMLIFHKCISLSNKSDCYFLKNVFEIISAAFLGTCSGFV